MATPAGVALGLRAAGPRPTPDGAAARPCFTQRAARSSRAGAAAAAGAAAPPRATVGPAADTAGPACAPLALAAGDARRAGGRRSSGALDVHRARPVDASAIAARVFTAGPGSRTDGPSTAPQVVVRTWGVVAVALQAADLRLRVTRRIAHVGGGPAGLADRAGVVAAAAARRVAAASEVHHEREQEREERPVAGAHGTASVSHGPDERAPIGGHRASGQAFFAAQATGKRSSKITPGSPSGRGNTSTTPS